MKKTAIIALSLFVVSSSFATDEAEFTFCSYAFEKRFTSILTYQQLIKSPSWNMERADTPPLPVGKAIRLSSIPKERLVEDSKRYRWHLESVTLDHLGWLAEKSDLSEKWWWSVTYEAHQREGGSTGGRHQLTIIVLMDGTVISPKVTIEDKQITQP